MSLVVGFSGTTGAILAGDLREILMRGSDEAVRAFEADLYNGAITDDTRMKERARDLGIALLVRDDKEKVSERDGILIGEVGETDGTAARKRRLYLTAGEYAIADIEGGTFQLRVREEKAGFVVLGNEATKRIAAGCIRNTGTSCSFEGALETIISIMETAASGTASVSRRYIILQSGSRIPLSPLIGRDSREVQGS